MGSYEIRRMYPASGLGATMLKIEPDKKKLASFTIASPDLASQIGGASNLMLGAAVVGVGLFAYLAAKALKK